MDNPLAILITLAIAAAWGAYLWPSVLGSRRNAPLHTTQEFDRLTARLAQVHGHRVDTVDVAKQRVLMRRRRILVGMVLAAIISLATAIWQGSVLVLGVHLAVDAIFAWYVAMLLQIKHRRIALEDLVDLRAIEESTEERRLRVVASQ